MDYKENFAKWLTSPVLEEQDAEELQSITDAAELEDRFCRDLAFGTGGLRGKLGVGTNRMNIYTVRKATQGLADYLNQTDLPKRVAIAHDSRNGS